MSRAITDADFDRLPADRQSSFARVKGPDNEAMWVFRSTLPGGALPAVEPSGRLTEQQLNGMSAAARHNYARQFDQKAFTNGGR